MLSQNKLGNVYSNTRSSNTQRFRMLEKGPESAVSNRHDLFEVSEAEFYVPVAQQRRTIIDSCSFMSISLPLSVITLS